MSNNENFQNSYSNQQVRQNAVNPQTNSQLSNPQPLEPPYYYQTNLGMPTIPEEIQDNNTRQQRFQTSNNATFAQTTVSRTISQGRKNTSSLPRTELANYKVENFRSMADQNMDMKSVKVIPLDDVSVEEAHIYQGEIRTINIQPVEVKQTNIPQPKGVDQSVHMSEINRDHFQVHETVIEQPMIYEQAIVSKQKIIVKDIVKKTQVDNESVSMVYTEKGIDWRTCCGILAAILFMVGIAALLRCFLVPPIVAVVPVVIPLAATNISVLQKHDTTVVKTVPTVTHIEHTKIRHKKGGVSTQSHQKIVTHHTPKGLVTHVIKTPVVHSIVANASHPLLTNQTGNTYLQGPLVQENKIFVTQTPFAGHQDISPQTGYAQIMATPESNGSYLIDSGISNMPLNTEPQQTLAIDQFSTTQQPINIPQITESQNNIQYTNLIQNGYVNSPQQPFYISSGQTQPELTTIYPQESLFEPQNAPSTIGQQIDSFLNQANLENSQTGNVQVQLEMEEPPSTINAPVTIQYSDSPNLQRQNKYRQVRIPQTVILPDDTVYHKVVRINNFDRKLNQNQPKVSHDFDELSSKRITHKKMTQNDLLNSFVKGEHSYEPYRHMKDFMTFAPPSDDLKSNEDFSITYKFKNAGTTGRTATKNSGKEPKDILVDNRPRVVVLFGNRGAKQQENIKSD